MQTQRDHVHAHQFMVGRLSSALVEGDPTRAEIPGQRAQAGLVVGVVLAVLLAGGFAVYGWLVPGGSRAFAQAGAILVEKETGNRYVYLNGVLHPTPDLTSALLIQGRGATVKLISRNSLRDLPRGPALGVRGAPQTVSPDALVRGPWLVCLPGAVPDGPGGEPSGAAGGGLSLGVNLDPGAVAEPLPADRFTVVADATGTPYLLAGGRKHRIAADSVLAALGAANARPVRASRMWLDWLPDGPVLAPARIDGAGRPGPPLDGTPHPVGALFRQRMPNGDEQLFVLRSDGLAPLDRTEFLLADAERRTAPVELTAAAVAAAPKSTDRSLTSRLPDLAGLRLLDPGDAVLCLRQRPVSGDALTSAVAFAPRSQSGVDERGRPFVRVRPGSGMVVAASPRRSGSSPRISYISDTGTAYPLPDAEAIAALKLDNVGFTPFPESLLAVLPQGPALSRAAVTGLTGG